MNSDEHLQEPVLSLEERVARLEGRLGWRRIEYSLNQQQVVLSFVGLLLALSCAYMGLGLPNHWYQLVLAALGIGLCYHREWLIAAPYRVVAWLLGLLNTALLAMLLKLVIGSGQRFPFFWALYPKIETSGTETRSWNEVLPKLAMSWEQSALALWSVDLTIIQTFLLILTFVGALVEFQPFASLTALVLVLISLPALVGFHWAWVFPALLLSTLALYLQSASYQEDF